MVSIRNGEIGTKKFFLRQKGEQEDKKTCACDVSLSNNSFHSNMKEHILQTVFLSAQVYRGTKPYLIVDAMYY